MLVEFPQAFRQMLPIIVAQLVVLLKDTSLGYIVGYNEIIRNEHQQPRQLLRQPLPVLAVRRDARASTSPSTSPSRGSRAGSLAAPRAAAPGAERGGRAIDPLAPGALLEVEAKADLAGPPPRERAWPPDDRGAGSASAVARLVSRV